MEDNKIKIEVMGKTTFVRIKLNEQDINYFYEKINEMDWFEDSFTWSYNSNEGKTVLAFKMEKTVSKKRREKTKWLLDVIIFLLCILGAVYLFQIIFTLFVN